MNVPPDNLPCFGGLKLLIWGEKVDGADPCPVTFTQTTFKEDLRGIHYLPFRGLLAAAAAEAKASKPERHAVVLTLRLWQRSKANTSV